MKKLYVNKWIGLLFLIFLLNPITVFAADKTENIEGKVYVSNSKDSLYETNNVSDSKAMSTLSLTGQIKSNESTEDSVPIYDYTGSLISDNGTQVSLNINYDAVLSSKSNWEIYEDSRKSVAGIDVSEKIKKGVIIVQSSFDGKAWNTDEIMTNVLSDTSIEKKPIYQINENQLTNGCYFKVVFAYAERKEAGKKLMVTQYQYRKTVNEYEFYIRSLEAIDEEEKQSGAHSDINAEVVNAGNNDGYSKNDKLTSKDIHYGWEMGKFIVSGYSGNVTHDNDNNPVFLKNVGDKVTLTFHLNQSDINKLNDQEGLVVNEDKKGYDQYFNIPELNFKRGALIIRFTDYQNHQHDPIVYTDFLAAAATTTADTKVQLFEEGDYEVALDYQLKQSDKLVGPVNKLATKDSYRMFFKFSVRNSNCMVFPIDLGTGSELIPSTYTESGFKLDLAKSRYLDINIRRDVLNGDHFDTRMDQVASDLTEYTDEGVYTINVKNEYTKDEVSKMIYVGTDNLLKAYVIHDGKESISDLQQMEQQGYTFGNDGSIISSENEEVLESEELDNPSEENDNEEEQTEAADLNNESSEENDISDSNDNEDEQEVNDEVNASGTVNNAGTDNQTDAEKTSSLSTYVLIIISIIVVICIAFFLTKSKKAKSDEDDEE